MEAIPREILICHTDDDRKPFQEWLDGLDPKVRARVRVRIDRVEEGAMGDTRSVGDGVVELRLDFGPGYRVYLGQKGNEVHLINGGSKQTQDEDIAAARKFWKSHE